jgi:hypothetical protein
MWQEEIAGTKASLGPIFSSTDRSRGTVWPEAESNTLASPVNALVCAMKYSVTEKLSLFSSLIRMGEITYGAFYI